MHRVTQNLVADRGYLYWSQEKKIAERSSRLHPSEKNFWNGSVTEIPLVVATETAS
jgi:hypothetical protein